MNHESSLVSTQHLAVWEIVRPHAHEPIKKTKKVERNFEENKISLEWGFSTKRMDDAFRSCEVEFGEGLFKRKLSVEIFQEEVSKISTKYDQKVEFTVMVKKVESKKLQEFTYTISQRDNIVLNFSSLFGIDYVKIFFSEQRNPFVDLARTTLKFSI